MRTIRSALLAGPILLSVLLGSCFLAAQDAPNSASADGAPRILVGHPFTAIKYARRVRILPNGKLLFIRNERYPTQVARDADGRLMMQVIDSADLPSECDRLDLQEPPVCPVWGVFVIDPVAHTMAHWPEGEISGRVAVDFPLTPSRQQEAAELTSVPPELGPDFTDEDGKMTKLDLGSKDIEGIHSHGVRWTLQYDANQDGGVTQRTRIFEVWTSPEMDLIVRVTDGDPNGEETVWGLEKISLAPDASLFRPPDGFAMQHQRVDRWSAQDFEVLKSWFQK